MERSITIARRMGEWLDSLGGDEAQLRSEAPVIPDPIVISSRRKYAVFNCPRCVTRCVSKPCYLEHYVDEHLNGVA